MSQGTDRDFTVTLLFTVILVTEDTDRDDENDEDDKDDDDEYD